VRETSVRINYFSRGSFIFYEIINGRVAYNIRQTLLKLEHSTEEWLYNGLKTKCLLSPKIAFPFAAAPPLGPAGKAKCPWRG
jgi:hypothetical protein